jgi:hypothetical protein
LKFEYQPLGGAVKDLAWDGESKRMAIVGEGRERFMFFSIYFVHVHLGRSKDR